ncbi:MAG: hypothetical protein F6K19_19825 [Cyanothece sp. SIO1E1]|nr:hypothetical protein [Cyanothece sp. SIO1E1]
MVNPVNVEAAEVKSCPPERVGAPAKEENARLSVFADLIGTWKGQGYNLIPLPVNQIQDQDKGARFKDIFRVEAQHYRDEITFNWVGCTANRGNGQPDQFAKTLAYHQKVTVDNDGRSIPIHEENGMILVLEPQSSTDGFTVARLASVPHGDSVLAMGNAAIVSNQRPKFPPLDSRPIKHEDGLVDTNPDYFKPYIEANDGLGLTAAEVQNPNLLLEKFVQAQASKGHRITKTATLELSTNNSGGISNIPFLDHAENLDVPRMDFTIWIEHVKDSQGQVSAQLQYSQNTLLDFQDFIWPHIDVSSLVKQ